MLHYSRLCSIIIDCDTHDLDAATSFWSAALGRAVNLENSGNLEKYRALETPPGQIKCEVQKVDHPSRVHIDIETDNIEAEADDLSFDVIGLDVDVHTAGVMTFCTSHLICPGGVQRTFSDCRC